MIFFAFSDISAFLSGENKQIFLCSTSFPSLPALLPPPPPPPPRIQRADWPAAAEYTQLHHMSLEIASKIEP